MSRTQAAREAIRRHRETQPLGTVPARVRSRLPPGITPAGARDKKFAKKPRLPEGALYVARWSNVRNEWEAVLLIPELTTTTEGIVQMVRDSSVGRVFEGQFGALFQLLEQVDKKYRISKSAAKG